MLHASDAHTKRTLLHLSRAIEAVHLADEGPSTLAFVLFQQRRYFDDSRHRFERWASEGGATIVAGFVGHPPYRRQGNLHCVPIDPGSPLAAEWSIVVSDGITAVSMVATERADLPTPADEAQRMFDTRLTFSPPYVADDLDRLLGALGPDLPAELGDRFASRVRRCARLPLADDEALLRPVLQVADAQVMAAIQLQP